MIAGLVLSDKEQLDSEIAFLGDEVKTYSLDTNEEIVEKISELEPEIIAVNSSGEITREQYSDQEEDLKDEGYNFTPSRTESKKIKRLQALKAVLNRDMLDSPEFIRFDPQITAEELAIDGDKALNSYGIGPSNIDSARQFDAVLGSITARFYQQEQFQDLGVVVPQSLESKDSEESSEQQP
jgi:hypothetical protein